jgi:uncharacterized protein (TIGR00369 family)
MRKLNNPFVNLPGYNCFGCSPGNQSGLQMTFEEDGEEIISRWDPKKYFQGYLNVLHGGIQATLIDEIASWTVYTRAGRAGVTSKLNVRYLKPVMVDEGALLIRAKLAGMRRNLAEVKVQLFNHENVLCAEGTVIYFTFSEEKSKESLYYPGTRKFFTE